VKLHDDHLYHGAALIQIAEHEKFTAINELKIGRDKYTNAYRINDDVAVYLKYATAPNKSHSEYVFTFHTEHINSIEEISTHCRNTYLALVCVKDREVCCLSYEELSTLIVARKKAKNGDENQYTILITAPTGKSLRAYVNSPGVKGQMIDEPLLIPRNRFPSIVFS
jgi:hypothetical protein